MLLLEQGVQGHGAVFAAAPAEEDGFGCGQENLLTRHALPRRGAACCAPTNKRRLFPPAEAVVHAEAEIAAEGGEADGLLISLVEEVGDASVERDAAAEVVTGGEIETGVAGIASEAEAVEVAVGADAGEVAGEIEIDTAKGGVQPEVAGVHGSTEKMI